MSLKVLCAGFVCADLVLRPVDDLPPPGGNRFVDDATLFVGGCAANAAIAFARLGLDVAVAGRVGDDPLGRLVRQALEAERVRADGLLTTATAATAINTALVAGDGERSFYVFPGACAQLASTDLPDSLLAGFDHLHLAAIGALPGLAGAAAADVGRRARTLGLSVSLDITLNPPRDSAADIAPLLPHVDLFLPNAAEAQAVLGGGKVDDLLDRGLASGVRLMGIKQGERGCALATSYDRVSVPAIAVATIDTVGAGDAWSAAVVFGWRKGWSLLEIGRFANAAGALCTLASGGTAGMADPASIHRLAGLPEIP
jgi:sugar/nucleoside kinase (ribokinase family)